MLAGVEGGVGDLGVVAVLHANGHRVDLRVVYQIVIGVIHLAAVFLRHLSGALGNLVVIAHQLGIGVGSVLRQVPGLGNLAAANDTDLNHSSASL